MFDKGLIRTINNGRCFVLVGSGPSCEVGYPSWRSLAEQTYAELKRIDRVSGSKSYERYLERNQYAELLRQAELDLGDRRTLINLIRPMLSPPAKNRGIIYELISKWPFACYLTTNFDDEIASYLASLGEYFTIIRNRQEDFSSFYNGVDHLIQKIHSDLNFPDEVVLTSADYRRFYIEDSGQYFRDKLRQIFEMFDIFIIGHSLSDPDIDHVLQLARKTRGPQRPIYMAAADFTKADEREYLEKYNIVLVEYSNNDGTHSELRNMLKTADRFIVPRHRLRERIGTEARPKEEVDAAIALFLYRRLQGVQAKDYLSPLILVGLHSAGDKGIAREDVASIISLKKFTKGGINSTEAISETIENLLNQGLVAEVAGNFSITRSGRANVREYKAIRETEKDQAYGQFSLSLKNNYSGLTDIQLKECQMLAEEVIVVSFASRGLTVANQVFSGHAASPGELSDIFGFVSDKAAELEDMGLRAAFVESMHQFLVEPSSPQRKYLASVSQGYFLYHLLGLDPKCCEVRQDIFDKTLWFNDSSVLLPLIAVGCYNHEYAVELFQSLTAASALLYTTHKLLQEAWEHFQWALDFIKMIGAESSEFLRAALLKGSYKQNLFLDGYIRLSAEGRIGSFKEYLELAFPRGFKHPDFDNWFVSAGVSVISVSDMDGFVQDDWGEIEEAKIKIRKAREDSGTYKSPLQVESEAEVWVIINGLRSGKYVIPDLNAVLERFYFVSQSRVLDKVFQPEAVSTWSPEAVYRYLSALPGKQTNPDLLQQCMLHVYYYAGISFIDKDRYIRFFGPSIDSAKASYQREKSRYVAELEETHTKNIDEAFDKTPDLEKPFFVAQMGWQVAEASRQREEEARQRALEEAEASRQREDQARQRALEEAEASRQREERARLRTQEAEARVKQLEAEKDKAWKTREKATEKQEAARLRNLQDPKHVKKRLKQAKKRRKKK